MSTSTLSKNRVPRNSTYQVSGEDLRQDPELQKSCLHLSDEDKENVDKVDVVLRVVLRFESLGQEDTEEEVLELASTRLVSSESLVLYAGRICEFDERESSLPMSEEARRFSQAEQLDEYVPIAYKLAGKWFKPFASQESLHFVLCHDPETDEKWLVLELLVDGPASEIRVAYKAYTSEWVRSTSQAKRHKVSICYNYGP